MFGGMLSVFGGVNMMAVSKVCVVSCRFMIAFEVMLCGFLVVACSVLMMLRCLGMMMGCFL
ncbi:MAG: hypothetical protein ACLPXB_05830 [Thiobacillaceae bacterium]